MDKITDPTYRLTDQEKIEYKAHFDGINQSAAACILFGLLSITMLFVANAIGYFNSHSPMHIMGIVMAILVAFGSYLTQELYTHQDLVHGNGLRCYVIGGGVMSGVAFILGFCL